MLTSRNPSSIMFNMNRLSTERRGQVIACLVEGTSMRAVSRITGAARNTIDKLLCDLGDACAEYQDGVLRNLPCSVLEADEIWEFCYAKQKNVPEQFQGTFGYGDVWTWVAIDADTLADSELACWRAHRRRRLHLPCRPPVETQECPNPAHD